MATRQGESAAASHSPSTPDDVDSPGFILVQLVSTMLSSPISMSDLKGTHSYRQVSIWLTGRPHRPHLLGVLQMCASIPVWQTHHLCMVCSSTVACMGYEPTTPKPQNTPYIDNVSVSSFESRCHAIFNAPTTHTRRV